MESRYPCFNLIHKQNKRNETKKKRKNHRVFTLFKLEFVPVIFQVQCERTANACLSRSRRLSSLAILTFRTGRFICFVPRHQVIKAAGFDPELLHSISYVLSAETNVRLAKIWTAAGLTVKKEMLEMMRERKRKRKKYKCSIVLLKECKLVAIKWFF